jgi:hypothetical protein
MRINIENSPPKKSWQCPKLFSLDINKTEGGAVITNFEDESYQKDSQ